MIIRKETEKDFNSIYYLIKEAFKHAEFSDGTEQDLVVNLRKGTSYIPELSLVAEIENKIVGHIMFTKLKINDHIALALAPLCVLPQYQNKGIGISLIKEGHKIAKELGYCYSIVLGNYEYYSKSGFLPAINFGIYPCFKVPSKNFMAYKLSNDCKNISGIVSYAEEFGINN